MPRSELRALVLVLGFALAFRLAVALLWAPGPTGDGLDYIRLAEGLARGEGFRNAAGDLSSWRPPLYPMFLVPFVSSSLAGPTVDLLAVRVVQAFLSTVSVALVYAAARPPFGPRVAAVAGLLAAVGFAHVAAVSRILSETLFTTLMLAAVAVLVRARNDRGAVEGPGPDPGGGAPRWAPASYLLSGALLGAAGLVRSVIAPFPILVAAGLLTVSMARRSSGELRAAVASGALVLAGAALVLSPWTIRNYAVHGAFVPASTQGGATLYAGNHPRDGYVFGVMSDDERTRAAAAMPEPVASRYLTWKAAEDLASDPGGIPQLMLLKLLYFWTPEDWELLPGAGRFNQSYAFVALWATLGLVLFARTPGDSRRAPVTPSSGKPGGPEGVWLIWLPVAYFVAVALVFYGSPRFRMPVEPLLSIFAAWGLFRCGSALGRQRTAAVVVVTAIVVMGVGATWSPVTAMVKSALAMVGAI